MEEEVFINGFCRDQNQGRTVVAVFTKDGAEWEADEVDCCYGSCPHQSVCEVAKQIEEWIEEHNKE